MRLLFAVALVAALALSASAVPQDPDTAERERQIARALAAVDEALASSESFRVAENRMRVVSMAASMLRAQDPARARAFLEVAAKALAAAVAELEPLDAKRRARLQALLGARQELVYMFAERDPAAALDFMTTTRAALPSEASAYQAEVEAQLEIFLAQRIAETDPRRSVEMAEAALERKVDHNVVNLITSLKERQPEAARALAAKLLAKLGATRLAESPEALMAAVYLLQSELNIRAAGESGNTTPSTLYDDASLRTLAELVVAAATRPSQANTGNAHVVQQALSSLSHMDAQLVRFAPALAEAVRRRSAGLGVRVAGRHAARSAIGPIDYGAPVEELLKAAAASPDGMRDGIYGHVAQRLASEGNLERARQIIAERVSNPDYRASILEGIDRQSLWNAINEEKYEEVARLLPNVESLGERVGILVHMSNAAIGRDDRKAAARWLGEAEALAGDRARNAEEFQARLQVAQAYGPLDPARGFAILESEVGRLNGLLDAAAALEGFGCDGGFEDGELLLRQGGTMNSMVFQVAEALAALARADVDRAAEAAGMFDRPEAEALALLRVAGALLAAGDAQGEAASVGFGVGVR